MDTTRFASPGQQETIDALLERSRRSTLSVPLGRKFVQPEPGGRSPLAELVRRGDERGLDLFLLHRACVSAEPWDIVVPAPVWARALGLTHGDGDAAESTVYGTAQVSKVWKRLEALSLIKRERSGRKSKVIALDESGLGVAYAPPSSNYSRLPFAYWQDSRPWYLELKLPAKAVLMISIQQRTEFEMPEEYVHDRYGVSRETWRRGVEQLADLEALRVAKTYTTNWLSAEPRLGRSRYELLGVFHRRERRRP